ncbi:AEC family transporter [Caldimonas brevitalea]|uniref:Transporter n=1 Tax=Caldimonas brevitalea TaxID=413882 RepID=A0A0G3BWA4_9BURK|nr:AEC family transporter [Caldimonas brevitalea]AKJ31681.1 transporter [Caldimonas brevitalea]
MQAIFTVTLPFFALVLCGYLAARARVLPEAAIPGLNSYVLFFALPCLLFRFGAGTPIAQLLHPVWLALYATCAVLVVALTVALSRRMGLGLKDAAFGALVAAFPNTGFMGVPLLVALLGERAAGPVIVTVLVDLLLTSSLCLALAQSEGAGHRRAAMLQALRGAVSNPLPWAIVLGAGMSVAQGSLPGPLAQIVKMLADSATPVALFTIGAVLWRSNQAAHGHTALRHVVPVVAIKLLLHPLLVLAVGSAFLLLGLPMTRESLSVLVLAAALPSASNVSLLAERYGADNGRIARIILASTTLAFFSFSFAVRWLG